MDPQQQNQLMNVSTNLPMQIEPQESSEEISKLIELTDKVYSDVMESVEKTAADEAMYLEAKKKYEEAVASAKLVSVINNPVVSNQVPQPNTRPAPFPNGPLLGGNNQ